MVETHSHFLTGTATRAIDLARAAKVDKATVTRWLHGRVPAERVLEVERITGVSRHDIRPDIYPPSTSPGHVSTPSTAPDTAKEAV